MTIKKISAAKSMELEKGGTVMPNQNTRKCAHIPCLCDVAKGQEYCGEACRYAGSEDVQIACQCDHASCPLTFRHFIADDTAEFAN
jgi:hypothetical protein